MGDIVITRPTQEHIVRLAGVMREADRLEVERAMGMGPEEALRWAVGRSTLLCLVALDGEEPVAMWGLAPVDLLTGLASPWMLSGEKIVHHKKHLLRASRDIVEQMLEIADSLTVMVDAEHQQAVRWLRWLGFDLAGPVPHGPQGHAFYRAEIAEKVRGAECVPQ